MVCRDQILRGWLKYAETDLARGRNDLMGRWGIPFLAGTMFTAKWNQVVEPNREAICQAGYMSPDGMVDIDRIHAELTDIAKRMGKAVQGLPGLGEYAFSDQDVDKLYQYIITS